MDAKDSQEYIIHRHYLVNLSIITKCEVTNACIELGDLIKNDLGSKAMKRGYNLFRDELSQLRTSSVIDSHFQALTM